MVRPPLLLCLPATAREVTSTQADLMGKITLHIRSLAFHIQARKNTNLNTKHTCEGQDKTMFHLVVSTKSPSHLKVKIRQDINKSQFQIKDALLLSTSRKSRSVLAQLLGVTHERLRDSIY